MESKEDAKLFCETYNGREDVKVQKDETSGSGTPYVAYLEDLGSSFIRIFAILFRGFVCSDFMVKISNY